ncbi:MAG: hypothetical protein AAFP98_09610 [Pseudomonadota bacterium]
MKGSLVLVIVLGLASGASATAEGASQITCFEGQNTLNCDGTAIATLHRVQGLSTDPVWYGHQTQPVSQQTEHEGDLN